MEQLQPVADEIRQYILETMSRIGGHTGASLGRSSWPLRCTTPSTHGDRLVWDVGHQAYAHKILTGRANYCRRSNNMWYQRLPAPG